MTSIGITRGGETPPITHHPRFDRIGMKGRRGLGRFRPIVKALKGEKKERNVDL